jgi:hypothetical protein
MLPLPEGFRIRSSTSATATRPRPLQEGARRQRTAPHAHARHEEVMHAARKSVTRKCS